MLSPCLPRETLDHVIDLLRDKPEILKECCLVSKSWVPRTQKHLFSNIHFRSASDLESWKKTFPSPTGSLAYHTHALFIGCPQAVEDLDSEEGGWIQGFFRLERLTVNCTWASFDTAEISLAPFCKLSLSLKSLRVASLSLPRL